ncbi:unnamed protein product [Angiostrongylus costaricensis]|uniref:Transmembrane protein n=1 Tax=Angiostrongylus costaricensis TaxID=334426 RepID=A0A0R3PYN6_ANGCS|nr:unnamed protein product [Angiostrongylus costaricensis]
MVLGYSANRTRLDLFLDEAARRNFPLNFTPMDCALRGYGAFVLWMHLVVYLIFKHIHGDVSYSPEEEQSLKEYDSPAVTSVLSPVSRSPLTKRSETVKNYKGTHDFEKDDVQKKACFEQKIEFFEEIDIEETKGCEALGNV